MADLVLQDEDFESMKSKYADIGTYFEEIISTYISELQNICDNGVKSGTLHDNLCSFKSVAEQLSGQIEATLDLAAQVCTDFITDIDEADKALY